MFSNSKITAFLGSSAVDDLSVLMRRRVVVATSFSLTGVMALIVMSAIAISRKMFFLLGVDLAFLSFLLYFIWRVKTCEKLNGTMTLGSIVFGVFGLFYYFYSGLGTNTHLWFYVYPLAAISIAGRKIGNILFLLFFSLVVLGSFWEGEATLLAIDPTNFVRFTLSLFVVFMVSSYMEQTSEDENDLLVSKNEALEKARKDLQELTIRDPLTGLFNRRYLDEVLPLAISQSRRYHDEIAIMMIDVDHFKKYNDFYGHLDGDEALRRVAEAISSVVRRNTDYVCRYGGEEFAIIMNKCNAAAVDRTADNIIKILEKENIPHVYGVEERITVSIGTATADQQGVDTHETLIARADKALYEAKKLGRNRYCKM